MNKFIIVCVSLLIILLFLSSFSLLSEGMSGSRNRTNYFTNCSHEETYHSQIGTMKILFKYNINPYEVNDISNYVNVLGSSINDMYNLALEIKDLNSDSTTDEIDLSNKTQTLVQQLKSNKYKNKDICEVIYTPYESVTIENTVFSDFMNKKISVVFNSDHGSIRVMKSSSSLNYDVTFLDDDNNDSYVVYQGNLGTIHVIIENGLLKVVDSNTSFSNDVNIGLFYGPNGEKLRVKKVDDKLVIIEPNFNSGSGSGSGSGSSSGSGSNDDYSKSGDYWFSGLSGDYEDSDYILKSKLVPPVCPACPSLNYCGNSGNNKSSNSVDVSENANLNAENISASNANINSNNNQDSNNTSTTNINYNINKKDNKIQDNNTQKMANGNNISNQPNKPNKPVQQQRNSIYSNTQQQSQSADVSNDVPIGSYLGNNDYVNNPMPVLNDFSSFGL